MLSVTVSFKYKNHTHKHGCHTALHFGDKAKENQDKVLRCTGYLNSIKNPIKQDLLLILVLVRQQNFLNF